MKFIVDTQLPPKLSNYFESRGHDSKHTTDFPNGHLLGDTEIRRIAIQENRVVVSKDSDFADMYFLKGAPPKVLLLDVGNIRNTELLRVLDEQLITVLAVFNAGSDFIVLNKDELFSY